MPTPITPDLVALRKRCEVARPHSEYASLGWDTVFALLAAAEERDRLAGEVAALREALKPLQRQLDAYCELNEIERYCGGYIHLSPDEVMAIVTLMKGPR